MMPGKPDIPTFHALDWFNIYRVSTLLDTVGEFRSGHLDGDARWETPLQIGMPERVPGILRPDRRFRQQCHYWDSDIR